MGNAPTQVMQGIEVPASSIDPASFFRLTRRLTVTQKTFTYAGFGLTDNVPILQTGIVSGLQINATGSLVIALPTGTAATTAKWPYDLIRAARFSANGQSNLINVGGTDLKAREVMARGDLTDRGVVQAIGGASPGTAVQQGTLSLSAESWGVGQNVSAIAAGTYGVDLEWYVPVAYDDLNLMGAIFAQTSSTDLNLAIDWANIADLFTLTGTATATLSLTVVVSATLYTIPVTPNGSDVIVPDLSVFHSLIKTRYATPGNGVNEIRLSGQGVGRQLLRAYFRTFNGAGGASAPLSVNATNYGQLGWRYGGNDTPEVWHSGKALAYRNEKTFCTDLARFQGYAVLDFCNENAFRDSIDEGTATELRLLVEIPNGVALVSPYFEYVQETLSAGAAV
jgi:hypothetical protein